MERLILEDCKTTYLVYYRPKDKVKLYEILFEAGIDWNVRYYNEMPIGEFVKKDLNSHGFKVVDISDEIKSTLNLRRDLSERYFTYKGVRVFIDPYGLTYQHKGRITACKSVEEAINLIDKELE